MSLFHFHVWEIIEARMGTVYPKWYVDAGLDIEDYSKGEGYTYLLKKCTKCGKLKTQELEGRWDLKSLKQ